MKHKNLPTNRKKFYSFTTYYLLTTELLDLIVLHGMKQNMETEIKNHSCFC
jgi:hypothetical protein